MSKINFEIVYIIYDFWCHENKKNLLKYLFIRGGRKLKKKTRSINKKKIWPYVLRQIIFWLVSRYKSLQIEIVVSAQYHKQEIHLTYINLYK